MKFGFVLFCEGKNMDEKYAEDEDNLFPVCKKILSTK
jgi:hypothetical protein